MLTILYLEFKIFSPSTAHTPTSQISHLFLFEQEVVTSHYLLCSVPAAAMPKPFDSHPRIKTERIKKPPLPLGGETRKGVPVNMSHSSCPLFHSASLSLSLSLSLPHTSPPILLYFALILLSKGTRFNKYHLSKTSKKSVKSK